MSEWITYVEAARVIGCAERTVARMVRDGRLVQRKGPRAQPSISAESARAVGVEVRVAKLSREQRAAERAAAKAARWTPPPDGNVWLSAEAAALVLGVTGSRSTSAPRTASSRSQGRADRSGPVVFRDQTPARIWHPLAGIKMGLKLKNARDRC